MTSGSDSKIRLLVLFGGQSAEHDVSCMTAAHVLAAADPQRYEIETIGISRDGEFVRAGQANELLQSQPAELPTEITPLHAVGPNTELLASVSELSPDGQVVVLPLLHGPLGEDGTVQGLCELAGVAYVGAGVLGSAATMDKVMAKTILGAHGIPQTAWLAFQESQIADDPEAAAKRTIAELGLPCFVKPANMGSSVGVSKASSLDELLAAMAKAFRYDEWIVIEEAVVAREIEVSVLGNHDLELSAPGEVIPGAEFYDYEDKYHDGNAQLVIPADLPPAVVDRIHELSVQSYRALRVEGMARADFLYEEGGRGLLVNELNTIPGFTPISMYPKMWEASGLDYATLIDRLVDLAIERHSRRGAKRITTRDDRST